MADTIGLGSLWIDGADIFWVELRPTEGGRVALVRWSAGQTAELTPRSFNARTRVHEYGGGAYAAGGGGVYVSNFADQRVYRLGGVEPAPLSPAPLAPALDLRYADGVVDTRRGLMFCVREDHTAPGEAVNTVAALRLDGRDVESGGRVGVAGHHFYSSPRLSPDGNRLCWLAWNHPNMPWDGTELWAAEVSEGGSIFNAQMVAGGPGESVFQPEWSPDGQLYFVSDRTGWWNLYRWQRAAGDEEPLYTLDAEFGAPAWTFRTSTYAFESANRIVCTYVRDGVGRLATLALDARELRDLDTPYSNFNSLRAGPGYAVCVAASPTEPAAVVKFDLASSRPEVLRRSSAVTVDPGYISTARPVEFPTTGGASAHAFHYVPRNRDYLAPPGRRPPLIVISHGGPTGATTSDLDLTIQYWTSRGFAVLDVNYGGSTGFGRAYRDRLKGQWGIVDVDDCVNGAKFLVGQGQADPDRLIIRGGSAGGYTALAALTFRDVFKAGASYYGISDLEAMATDTHKFESRYLDGLIGPYPARKDLYVERSPIHFTQRLSCPMILFQGLEDKVVPPDQSQKMYEAVRAKELPVAYVAYPGEQHGFRQAQNIKHSLDSELYFYSRIFKFDLADPVTPIEIENL